MQDVASKVRPYLNEDQGNRLDSYFDNYSKSFGAENINTDTTPSNPGNVGGPK